MKIKITILDKIILWVFKVKMIWGDPHNKSGMNCVKQKLMS